MSGEAWYTLAVAVVVVVVLVRDLLPPSAAFVGAMVAVLVPGVVEPAEAFSGFSNPATITIAAVYVLARGIEKTGILGPFLAATLAPGGSDRRVLARLTAPVAALSALMNNTPIVAVLAPQVERWAEREGRSPSMFLMPLSFAAILGGVVTVIGTATNLVVSGLFEAAGMEPMGFFEISKVGLPAAAVGLVVLVWLGPRLLPDRRSALQELGAEIRQFAIEMIVLEGGALDGATVEGGGLRHLAGVFLAEIERGGDVLAPVAPDMRMRGGDRLRFYGRARDVVDLDARKGLRMAAEDQVSSLDTRRAAYFEAVVGAASPLVGRTLKESGFRDRYQAAVVAIHRAGQRLDRKLGSIPLRVGDTLLLVADPGWSARWRSHNHFLLAAPLEAPPPAGPRHAGRVAVVLASVVVLAASGATPLVSAALVGAVGMVLLGVLTPGEARAAVDLDVIVMIAAAFGFAAAMGTSGLALEIAVGVVDVFGGLGDLGLLAGVVIATSVLTQVVTNNAAALLLFPIAVNTATEVGLNPRGFGMAVAVTAALAFLTPIGYQTNIMVYGPGGYRFTDYLRLGLPLTVATIGIILVLVPVFWPL